MVIKCEGRNGHIDSRGSKNSRINPKINTTSYVIISAKSKTMKILKAARECDSSHPTELM